MSWKFRGNYVYFLVGAWYTNATGLIYFFVSPAHSRM